MSDYESVDEVEEVEEEEEEDEESDEEPAEVVVKKRRAKKTKDPNKPKRAMSAFFLYSQAFRAQVKEDNPGVSFGETARILSTQYKALPQNEKKKWEAKAKEDKSRYQDQMKDYTPLSDEETGGKKKKAKKDPNAPKRNMSAYFLYSMHARPQVKESNPEATFGDIARLISAQFKALPADEKATWTEKAAADKERYQREMAEYNGGS